MSPTVPGSGDFGEFVSVLGIPLTTTTEPETVFDLPFQPLQNIFVIRDTSGPTRIDAYDIVEQMPSPSRAVLDVRVQNPVGVTDGPDGLLHAIGQGAGGFGAYAVALPQGLLVTSGPGGYDTDDLGGKTQGIAGGDHAADAGAQPDGHVHPLQTRTRAQEFHAVAGHPLHQVLVE